MCEVEVDALGRGVLLDDKPASTLVAAARGLARLVEVDGDGVVGEVCVVDAVAAHVFALRPLGAELRDFLETRRELIGRGDEHGDGRPVLEGDGGARRGCRGRPVVVAAGGVGIVCLGVEANRGRVASE